MQLLEEGYSNELSSDKLQDLLVKICRKGIDVEDSTSTDVYKLFWDGKRLVSRHRDE